MRQTAIQSIRFLATLAALTALGMTTGYATLIAGAWLQARGYIGGR